MASDWRRRALCTLVGDRAAPAALLAIDGHGATIATTIRPAPGARVALHHPEAGAIHGEILGGEAAHLHVRFAGDMAAVAFALSAIAADMSWSA